MSPKHTTSAKSEAKTGVPGLLGILLLMCCGVMLVLGSRAGEGQVLSWGDVLPFGVWLVSSLLLILFLYIFGFSGFSSLVSAILLLSGLGVLVRARMTGAVEGVGDMALWVQPLGFAWIFFTWLFFRKNRAEALKSFWPLAALLSPGLIGAVLALGSRFRGAMYGPGAMTPTELLKVTVPFALAGYFSHREALWKGRPCWNPPLASFLFLGIAWIVLCGLLVLQRDLGLLVLLSLTLAFMLMAVTHSSSWGLLTLAAGAGGLWAAAKVFAHGARRLEAWQNPFADPTGAGWQVLQGLSGLYAGGLAGTGLGAGRPDRLPIAGSDFVYAVYGEETGYIGCLLLLGLYGLLLRSGFRIASNQHQPFSYLLACGICASLAVQTLVNIAGVVTLLPITGITLPYISQGGSSFWVTSVQFGILLGLSEVKANKGEHRKQAGHQKRP